MGVDIHLYVEIKNDDGKWESADKWSPDPYECGDDEDIGIKWDDRFYSDRNYDLFAILANVRNGYGFAGVPTGTGFNPISQPRGLPEDVSLEVKAASDRYGIDGHSHSWLTIAELLAYDWNQTTKHTGMVNMRAFAEFQANGKPRRWCGAVSGLHVKQISNQEMAERVCRHQDSIDEFNREFNNGNADSKASIAALVKVNEAVKDDEYSYFTRIYWYETYADCCALFLEQTLPKLQALGQPENVRIVFFFDN